MKRSSVFALAVLGIVNGTSAQDHVDALPVPRFRDAVVVPPSGAGPKPVIVVLHGMGDSPDSICPSFEALVRGRAWILCPRGEPWPYREGTWTYSTDRRRVAAEAHASVNALRAAHPDRVDASTPVMAGFSLGAMFAAFTARAEPAAFPRAFIIDTHYVWSLAQLQRFRASHGRAIAFVCSHRYVGNCHTLCARSGVVPGAAVPTWCSLFPDREHGYDEELFDLVRHDFDAVVATDPRWAP